MGRVALYKFFLANQDHEIGYARIKKIEDMLMELDEQTSEHPLTELMATGVVERTSANRFRLSPSCFLVGYRFALGVNVPTSVIRRIPKGMVGDNRSGLLILDGNVVDEAVGLTVSDFNLANILQKFNSICKQIDSQLAGDEKFEPNSNVQVFHPSRQKWVPFATYRGKIENLFRVPISQHHFIYRFEVGSRYSDKYRSLVFQRGDMELLARAKVRLCLNERNCGLTYRPDNGVLCLLDLYPFPPQLRKLLFANHILCTGEFPQGNTFFLDQTTFKQLNRIFDNQIKLTNE